MNIVLRKKDGTMNYSFVFNRNDLPANWHGTKLRSCEEKPKRIKKQKVGNKLLSASFSFPFGLIFDPGEGGDMFSRNVGLLSSEYTASYPKHKTLCRHPFENLKSRINKCVL
jgi:hypothetical protein